MWFWCRWLLSAIGIEVLFLPSVPYKRWIGINCIILSLTLWWCTSRKFPVAAASIEKAGASAFAVAVSVPTLSTNNNLLERFYHCHVPRHAAITIHPTLLPGSSGRNWSIYSSPTPRTRPPDTALVTLESSTKTMVFPLACGTTDW